MVDVRARVEPWLGEAVFQLDELRTLTERDTDLSAYPHAADVRENVLVYSAAEMVLTDRRTLQAELISALADGPGVVVFAGAFPAAVVDPASAAFADLIAAQRQAGAAAGDHFGAAGANDRVWNAAQKLALHSPEVYADYYANDLLALVCQAWLGPRYQVTSQVNVVNPGGAAQVPHRDYHLGFVAPGQLTDYPAHVHRLSPTLTLQGAVAHTDMPLASGPTMLLPYSQLFEGGYVAFNRPEFVDDFAAHQVQIPLRKGDAVFFNPALYHGAGANTSADVRRMANLLQISSPFGRTMEALDRTAMVRAVYPALRAMTAAGRPAADVLNAVVATAEGYPFPTNLDQDQPIGSLAPPSQVDVVLAALADDLTPEALDVALRDQNERRIP
ncbi:ectoine hydroxylase-related dioxygenase (phytanoyl-CoA dioxygenase family) [Mycolicibacterium sp. BK556]|uniref:phytanoyl-CoA dioxygenase family protein n=1 Tax=unclassified Mycolicibacterium TaxID=2636767 RepID=UPI001618743A|nr:MULTISPECIES: phytanoyl-CoA dioxygenase family protein [unclassified Mycolicibacterium]MBB3603157.1 ectoine hydroxylase-related dioxygenase (phytanoyl-CoA dioxygenase family) [Mycolicibacterium sp. BK556]MBB3633352.1 ectoine hydroxylase-related dioxygenase (phytanoyl-CoA dioxygenase family) [Mycolicibacterium sp. BK607]